MDNGQTSPGRGAQMSTAGAETGTGDGGGDAGIAWRGLMWAVDRLAELTEGGDPRFGVPSPRPGPGLGGPDAAGGVARPDEGARATEAWPTDASQDHERYRAWLGSRAVAPPGSAGGAGGPSFSVVVPVYRTDLWVLRRCVESVRAQTWANWELCLCDDGSQDPALATYLRRLARPGTPSGRRPHGLRRAGHASRTQAEQRIKVAALDDNQGISAATNRALALAGGEFVALLDHDDELTPWALESMAAALAGCPGADVAYSDEDKLDEEGRPFGPRFKPDWSPDYLLTTPYMGHLFVIRRSLMTQLGGMRTKMDGSQDYDLMLRATEAARTVLHVPEVAYHWRVVPGSAAGDAGAKPWAYAASGRALTSALRRRGEDAELEPGPMPGMWHVRRRLAAQTTVSVVMSAFDGPRHLRACADALAGGQGLAGGQAGGVCVSEVTVAAPARPDLETRALLRRLAERPGFEVPAGTSVTGQEDQPAPAQGRVSACNVAARSGTGELVLFLDSRVMPPAGGWLQAMAEHAMRPDIGPVGARLISPAGRVCHVGLVLGLGGRPAAPVLEGLPATDYGYLEAARVTRNWSAVSGQCLMIRRSLLDSLGYLDEAMGPWAHVDLCLRAGELGHRCLVTPLAELVADLATGRVGGDCADTTATGAFLARWGAAILAGDPYFSSHLSRLRTECVLAGEEDEARWNQMMSTLLPSSGTSG